MLYALIHIPDLLFIKSTVILYHNGGEMSRVFEKNLPKKCSAGKGGEKCAEK